MRYGHEPYCRLPALDPSDTGVTLDTLSRVARPLGLGLKVSLARAPRGEARASLRKTE